MKFFTVRKGASSPFFLDSLLNLFLLAVPFTIVVCVDSFVDLLTAFILLLFDGILIFYFSHIGIKIKKYFLLFTLFLFIGIIGSIPFNHGELVFNIFGLKLYSHFLQKTTLLTSRLLLIALCAGLFQIRGNMKILLGSIEILLLPLRLIKRDNGSIVKNVLAVLLLFSAVLKELRKRRFNRLLRIAENAIPITERLCQKLMYDNRPWPLSRKVMQTAVLGCWFCLFL